jgi:hypothetical protein
MAAPAAVVAGAGLGCLVVLWGDPTVPGGPLPVCPTKFLLGIDCPGCGTLRVVYSLLHADLGAAVRFNALALVALPLLVWAWVAWTRGRWRGRRVSSWQDRRWAPMITLVVTVGWFVVRNIPVAPFTSLRA